MRWLGLTAAILAIGLAVAATPEPPGYWTGPTHSPVPSSLTGGKVIHARRLAALLKDEHQHAVIVDVSSAPRRPENLPTSSHWLPLPHHAIPGAIWIPGAGLGDAPAQIDSFYRQRLAAATGNDPNRTVIVYCHTRCWLSWNGAKRAISYGYRNVYWFPDGIEGWRAVHFPTTVVTPEATP
ncbi:MAG TPA: rhodanese-like domain-containing protein [Steroidobacteraceae bacterium]|jgi:PQQ-dependent catabolism-associated CXXCW motif protein